MTNENKKSTFEPVSLNIEQSQEISIGEILEKTIDANEFGDAAILVYTPQVCSFAEWDGSALVNLDGTTLHEPFEFRCFCEKFELRWVRNSPKGYGRSVTIKDVPGDDFLSLPGNYLLWGKKKERGMSVGLYEHRIGNISLPSSVGALDNASHIVLTYKEYFKKDDYGNVLFFAERLVALRGLEV